MSLQQPSVSTTPEVTTDDARGSSKLILENLPNELLYLIFDYLYCYEIIYAFFNLNIRFQILLTSYSCYHLNTPNEIKQLKFNLVQRLPLNIKHVKSLILTKNPYAITHLHQFLSIYPIDLFRSTLQFLSLTNIYAKLMFSIICSLRNFKQIKYLKISSEHHLWLDNRKENLFREAILFRIKTLKYFIWNTKQLFLTNDYIITCTRKTTIEYFHFDTLPFEQLEWLYSHTFNLKSISILNSEYSCSSHQPYTFEKLTSLKLNNIKSEKDIQFVFKHLTCLTHLKQLEFNGELWYSDNPIDGYKWRDLIENFVPQLKIFKFYFILTLLWSVKSTIINPLIESFQTDFWLIKKQWFIALDFDSYGKNIYYYTIPCIRNKLEYLCAWKQISTTIRVDTSNIRQLILNSVIIEHIKFNHQFGYVQSLILKDQHQNINYNPLEKLVNFSSVKHLEFRSEKNWKLLFNILENTSTITSLTIDYGLLRDIMKKKEYLLYCHFKKIQSLYLPCDRNLKWEMEYLYSLCTYFPNVVRFSFKGVAKTFHITYLIRSLESLSFLVTHYSRKQPAICWDISNWSSARQHKTLKKNNIVYRWKKDEFCLWIE